MDMKNIFIIVAVGVACLFAGATIQQIRMDSDPEFVQLKQIAGHKECLGCCINKCPCEDNCSCEFCLCADKEVAFSVVRKQLERIDQCGNCCDDREWVDWVVGYKKK